jgi:O-acetylhomoserine/O-acetylserine sulfhydrylase-like pyridoxal-dependent enzyme
MIFALAGGLAGLRVAVGVAGGTVEALFVARAGDVLLAGQADEIADC